MRKLKIGITAAITGQSLDVAVLARKAEELGFESLWLPDHPIIPVRQNSGFRGVPGVPIPDAYNQMIDPFVGLARASAVTARLKLGTGICLVPERNPLLLAKEVATLDYLSGGRFLFGIGVGWLKEETEIMGGDFEHRWTQTREAVLAMKELWTREESEFHGKYYDFPPVRSFPKPVQKPHPPVILGGFANNVFKRVTAWGDGWMPTRMTPEQLPQYRTILDDLAARAGRDPRSIEITIYGQPADADLIQRYENAGANRVLLRLEKTEGKEALAQLETMARNIL